MLEFIQLLCRKYLSIADSGHLQGARYLSDKRRLEQLLFAEAHIKKTQLLAKNPETPLQIAVVGPTQSGKSTVCNLLLGSYHAKVSPLPGYTVHAQGFCKQTSAKLCTGLQDFFGKFQQVSQDDLQKTQYDRYSLTETASTSSYLPECVLWDTADFDSIDAGNYQEGVIRTMALADIIVLVVSKEKYADLTVWEMLATIAPLRQPIVLCLNKVLPQDLAQLRLSLAEKWQQTRDDDFPEVVCLADNQTTGGVCVWQESAQNVLVQLADQRVALDHFERQNAFIKHHWQDWIAPLKAEHEMIAEWRGLVDDNITQIALRYEKDFLDTVQYKDFKMALLRLMDLLEIPIIAGAAGKVRRVVTWPITKTVGLFKKTAQESREDLILQELGKHFFTQIATQLQIKIIADSQNEWRHSCAQLLDEQKSNIVAEYEQAIDEHARVMGQEIEDAAKSMCRNLENSPKTLNLLRAIRTSADLAALATIFSPAALYNIAITPVVFSLTSSITQSAVGVKMQIAQKKLKERKLAAVKKDLFGDCLQQPLNNLAALLADARFGISEKQLENAEIQLRTSGND